MIYTINMNPSKKMQNEVFKSFLPTKALTVIFLIALYVLILGTFLVYQQIQSLSDTNNEVIHTYQVIGESNNLLLSLLDAQRLTQNYRNYADNKYTVNYKKAIDSANKSLESLSQLTGNDSYHQSSLKRLKPKMIELQALLDEAITERNQEPHKASSSQELLGQIKFLILNMNNQEYQLLEGRTAQLAKDTNKTNLLVIVIGSLSNFMLLVSFLLLNYQEHKYLEKQIQINRELAEKNLRIEKASHLKNEFLANMSHELRTPLNAIIGFSELIADERIGPINLEQKDFLNNILLSSKELLRLINDVLDLSKIEEGKMTFHFEMINIKELADTVVNSVRDLAIKKNISLTLNFPDTYVKLDEIRFRQIFYNYLSNALKFTPDFGAVVVTISLNKVKKWLILEVQDNGIGIKEEQLDQLFVEFQQLDASKAKKYQGTGLGLALTKHLVEAQGGVVGVQSKYGEGSVFSASIPYETIAEESFKNKVFQYHLTGD